MTTQAKEIVFEEEAKAKLQSGINQVANAVCLTLGPKGRNIGIGGGYNGPSITSDGGSIIESFEAADSLENMGVSIAKEVASRVNESCGDGTTTSLLILNSLVNEGIKRITAGASPILLKRGMEKAAQAIGEELEKRSSKVDTAEAVKNVAQVSASGNELVGELISQAVTKVGKDGVITVESGKSIESEVDYVEGMELDRGYISPYFINNAENLNVEMENPYLLVTDKKISSIQDLLEILQTVAATSRSLLIVAQDLDGDALSTLVLNKMRGTLKVAAIKAPGFGDKQKALLEDLCALTGATFISEEQGQSLKETLSSELGSCEKLIITKDKTTIIGGKGSPEAIQTRIKQIEAQEKAAKADYDKKSLLERRAKLQGGVAVIRVGAASESELASLKQSFQDSLNATKAAMESGVVVGAGMALISAAKNIKLELSGDEAMGAAIVIKASGAPARQIIENAGFDSSVILSEIAAQKNDDYGFNAQSDRVEDLKKAKVFDPTKVVRESLRIATHEAAIVLLSEVLITDAEDDDDATS